MTLVLCSGSHKAAVKVPAGVVSSEARGPLPRLCNCYKTSLPRSCRTQAACSFKASRRRSPPDSLLRAHLLRSGPARIITSGLTQSQLVRAFSYLCKIPSTFPSPLVRSQAQVPPMSKGREFYKRVYLGHPSRGHLNSAYHE